MIGLEKIDRAVDYCTERRITAMDVRGWGGLKRIDVAVKAGAGDNLTRDQWSVVCEILESRARVDTSPATEEPRRA